MKKKDFTFTGLSTPLGGISWESKTSTNVELKHIIVFLSGKRILTAPIINNQWGGDFDRNTFKAFINKRSRKDYAVESVIEIKKFILDKYEKIMDDNNAIRFCQRLIDHSNEFLDRWNNLDSSFIKETYDVENFEDLHLWKRVEENLITIIEFRIHIKQILDEIIKSYNIDFQFEIPTK